MPSVTTVDIAPDHTHRRSRFSLHLHSQKDSQKDTSPEPKERHSRFKTLVHMIKDGPAQIYQESLTEEEVDEEADAPMPRKKTPYEVLLKHQLRMTQVKNYTELVEREEMKKDKPTGGLLRLRRNRSGNSLVDEQTPKRVRFFDEEEA